MNTKQLIWVDDEKRWVQPYVDYLKGVGYMVRLFPDIDTADQQYDQCVDAVGIILDVMMPGGDLFTEEKTEEGHRTGLLLLARWRDRIVARGQHVFVLTNRGVDEIKAEVKALNFPHGLVEVEHKGYTNAKTFPNLIENLLGKKPRP